DAAIEKCALQRLAEGRGGRAAGFRALSHFEVGIGPERLRMLPPAWHVLLASAMPGCGLPQPSCRLPELGCSIPQHGLAKNFSDLHGRPWSPLSIPCPIRRCARVTPKR